jgi:hypothetical protein
MKPIFVDLNTAADRIPEQVREQYPAIPWRGCGESEKSLPATTQPPATTFSGTPPPRASRRSAANWANCGQTRGPDSRIYGDASIAQVEVEVQVFGGVQFPPRRGHPCGWKGRRDGHPVDSYELVQLQSSEDGNVPDGYLEGPERAQRGSLVGDSGARYLGQVIQLGCLVHDVTSGRQVAVMQEHGDLEEAQRDVHAEVDRVGGSEDGPVNTTTRRLWSAAFSCR